MDFSKERLFSLCQKLSNREFVTEVDEYGYQYENPAEYVYENDGKIYKFIITLYIISENITIENFYVRINFEYKIYSSFKKEYFCGTFSNPLGKLECDEVGENIEDEIIYSMNKEECTKFVIKLLNDFFPEEDIKEPSED